MYLQYSTVHSLWIYSEMFKCYETDKMLGKSKREVLEPSSGNLNRSRKQVGLMT